MSSSAALTMIPRIALVVLVLLATALLACGDTTDPPAELTAKEAAALFGEVLDIISDSVVPPHFVVPCPGGGEMTISVEVSLEVVNSTSHHRLTIFTDRTIWPKGCGVNAKQADYTLNGELYDDWKLHLFARAGDSIFYDTVFVGNVGGHWEWARGKETGSCSVKMPFTSERTAEATYELTHDGTVCNHPTRSTRTVTVVLEDTPEGKGD